MEQTVFVEWFGYVATVVVAVSLMMKSIIKLRWINLLGSSMFAAYGFAIDSTPVFVLNTFIAIINIYYLVQASRQKEFFKFLDIKTSNLYMQDFIVFYEADIRSFMPNFNFDAQLSTESFFMLRNMQVAGLFLGHRFDSETLLIDLDFAVPEYRDFKLAKYLFNYQGEFFRQKGYTRLYSKAESDKHNSYLKKLGFKPLKVDGQAYMVKKI